MLHWVNRVAVQFLLEEEGRHSRVKRLFAERSFRHYQTLGPLRPNTVQSFLRCGDLAAGFTRAAGRRL
jgi:hypothetical protein